MKILFVNNGLAGGGAEKLANDLLPLLNVGTNQCSILILSDDNEKYVSNLVRNNIRVDIIPQKIRGRLSKIRFIKKYIKQEKPDIVHANCFPTFYYCSIAKKLIGKKSPKFILTEHNTDNRRRHHPCLKPLEKWIYQSYDHILSISEGTQKALIDWLKPKAISKFSVAENGVPLSAFLGSSPYQKKNLAKNIRDEDILLCMVGSFSEQKNHDLALKIIHSLPDNYKLVLVGEGSLKETIDSKIKELELENKVIQLGFRTDVGSVIKTCDIMLIPSKWEGFGLIAVEAMACGKPVVASNVPGLADVVGSYGILSNPADPNSFIDGINLLTDPEVYADYCNRSLVRCEDYQIEKMVKLYLDTYQKVLSDF